MPARLADRMFDALQDVMEKLAVPPQDVYVHEGPMAIEADHLK